MPQPQAGGDGPTLLCYEQLLDQALVTPLSLVLPVSHLILNILSVICPLSQAAHAPATGWRWRPHAAVL
jgi:hypothetical protein